MPEHFQVREDAMNDMRPQTRLVERKDSDQKSASYWRLIGWLGPTLWGLGVVCVVIGYQTMWNSGKEYGDQIANYQYAAQIGNNLILVGIAAFVLGGTLAVLNVLVKTRGK